MMKTLSCWYLSDVIDVLLHPIDAHALFECVIGTFPPDRGRPFWERWARHEYQYVDLAAAHKLETCMADAYANGKNLLRFNPRL